MTTYDFENDIVWCGCFIGNLYDFENQVETTHKNNEEFLKEYRAVIKMIKSLK